MQTLVRNLKPGDILPCAMSQGFCIPRSVVIATYATAGNQVDLQLVQVAELNNSTHVPGGTSIPTMLVRWNLDSKVVVESPDLTPAQQHADKLLDAARNVLKQVVELPKGCRVDLRLLMAAVELVDPPNPPTLEEALDVLRTLVGPAKGWSSTADEAARKLLARVK